MVGKALRKTPARKEPAIGLASRRVNPTLRVHLQAGCTGARCALTRYALHVHSIPHGGDRDFPRDIPTAAAGDTARVTDTRGGVTDAHTCNGFAVTHVCAMLCATAEPSRVRWHAFGTASRLLPRV